MLTLMGTIIIKRNLKTKNPNKAERDKERAKSKSESAKDETIYLYC